MRVKKKKKKKKAHRLLSRYLAEMAKPMLPRDGHQRHHTLVTLPAQLRVTGPCRAGNPFKVIPSGVASHLSECEGIYVSS